MIQNSDAKWTYHWALKEEEEACCCLIRLKRIYNFLCSMLVFTPFTLCFVTLRGIFMWFPKLTYWQDATVPVPCFLLFLCFRNVTQEIFLKLDEISSRTPIFPGRGPKTERELEGVRGQPHHEGAWPGACGETTLVASWRRPFAYEKPPDGKP
jgi:hypothetical protein